LIIILGVIVLSLVILVGYAWAGKKVTLQVDRQVIEVKTKAATVEKFLQEHQVELAKGDEVTPGLETKITRDMVITVHRAKSITLIADGKEERIVTTRDNVEELLQEKGLSLGALDLVEPGLTTPLSSGMTVKITRVEKKIEEKEIVIPFNTERREDKNLEKGKTRVIKEGKNGKKIQQLEVTYIDGKVGETIILNEQVIAEPVAAIVAYGTKKTSGTIQTSRGEITYSRKLTMRATAYSPEDPSLKKYGGKTATGIKAARGVAAVDPAVIPLGTRLYVNGYGFALAADTGGAIKGNKIDLCFDTLSEARKFGTRTVTVYMLER
jgi:uncharacterized protein YabE (DUF348 family)